MSKEWLEEIENELERSNRAAKNGNTIGAEQMVLDLHEIGSFERLVKYSKKQTKRVQELEEDCEYLSHHYGLEAEQNKRYREELDILGEVINSAPNADKLNEEYERLKGLEGEE